MKTYKAFFDSLSSNGKQFVKRFIDSYERYDIDDDFSDYLEFKLSAAVKRGLISETESNFIFDYFTMHDE